MGSKADQKPACEVHTRQAFLCNDLVTLHVHPTALDNSDKILNCPLCPDPPCENGGEVDKSETTKCKCKCKDGAVGDRCEIVKTIAENSVTITIGAAPGGPTVSKSKFDTTIWPIFTAALTKAINRFCPAEANFDKCCPGKTFPGASAASSEHIKEADLKVVKNSLTNGADGSLSFGLYAVPSSSGLCSAGASGRKRRNAAMPLPMPIPLSVMLSVVKINKDEISAELEKKVDGITIKDVQKFSPSSLSKPLSKPPASDATRPHAKTTLMVGISCALVLVLMECMRDDQF